MKRSDQNLKVGPSNDGVRTTRTRGKSAKKILILLAKQDCE